MTGRIIFSGIVVFWVTMNFFLWREEFAGNGEDLPVPVQLVWRKILTAPDSSSMTIYQGERRIGFCEFSTSIQQQMAVLEEDKLPLEGFAKRGGYQIHLGGEVAFAGFTNRLKFDGFAIFTATRQWSELNVKISSRDTALELHSLATNQTVHLKISGESLTFERDLAFTKLKDPATLLRTFGGEFGAALGEWGDFSELTTGQEAQNVSWQSWLTHVKFGGELVPVYRLESAALGRTCTVDVSTLGEILRIQLPGNITGAIDEWSKP